MYLWYTSSDFNSLQFAQKLKIHHFYANKYLTPFKVIEAMEIILKDLDNQGFDTNEIMITVIGKRATQCSWDDIQVTLNRTTAPAGAEEDSFYSL